MEEGSLAIKERECGQLHLQLLLGTSWVSYKTIRLLKPINGMALHCSAILFITSRANSMNSVFFSLFFYLQWLQAKVCWRVDDFQLWVLWPFLMFTGRTCSQLNWGIIKQTHQTCRLLQCQRSQRKTLIKYVGSQTRWREASQACIFIPDRNSV